ncbi:pneumococcal serine-rich repeat protein isoform X2 [Eurosta solidaginis]|uniref:pneumococcal serine-rich repeat protein isoform X2 n=1 Tax=Eurosta solidaginis TaxID=178769 RepID=UPI003530E5F9
MAPALNEPMSPTEKLSNSTAEAASPPIRSMKSVSDNESTNATPITNCNTIDGTEKRALSSSIAASAPSSSASNPTRSKDAYQRVFEQTVSPSISASSSTSTPEAANTLTKDAPCEAESSKQTHTDPRTSTDLMGLNIILENKEHSDGHDKTIANTVFADAGASPPISKGNPSNINNNDNTSISCKSNSTEQLLADLTNDIEEAITTKVCIRKEITGDKGSNSTLETEIKSIKESRESAVTAVPITTQASRIDPHHVEDGCHCEPGKNENIRLLTKAHGQNVTIINEKKELSGDEAIDVPILMTSDSTTGSSSILMEASDAGHLNTRKTDASTRLQIISVDVLPPISTDSTMTASEVEDNLEERLSQLDGTAVPSPNCDDVNSVTSVGINTIPTTPPRTSPKQQTHQQQIKQLQQTLQQSPPTPLSQPCNQQQPHTFTPQSTSSVNTLSSANLPPAFMKESVAGELEDQDIEEVLKVLKGFDGSAGADTLCDLNVLFNEEYTLINYEEVSSQPVSSSAKPSPLTEMQIEIERNQQTMHRRIDFLLRRMRKIQSRYMSKHCSEEIAGLFEWTARICSDKGGNVNRASNLLQTDTAISVIAARPPASNWTEERNPVSSSQMSSMLRRLEQSANAQQLCMISTNNNLNSVSTQLPRKSKKALIQETASMTAGASSMTSSVERRGEVLISNYDINVSEEMSQVAGLLQTELREIQMSMDSDATESSSGGESADEMVTYNNQIQQPLAIAKRAAWRYSRERAAIAARWSWLLSQIADLEIKIRQQSELRQEIVRTKGAVVCGIEEQVNHISNIKSNTSTSIIASSVNGYKGNRVANACSKIDTTETNETDLMGAARTRGFVASLFRKRKLLQTQSLHTISKKAARPSNIKCGCQWPFNPCALCTGRIDPTAPRDPPDTMMMADRIALLDIGYHPVLSFREDVSSTLHLESIARMPEWQQRVMRCQVKSIAKSVWKAEREAERAATGHTSKKYTEPAAKRRYIKKKDRLAAEERNAAAAAASSTATATNPSSAAGHSSDSTANLAAGAGGIVGGGGISGVLTDVSALSACATTTSLQTCESGNGTGILSTSSSTTPLVANKSTKNLKKIHHYHLVGDGVLLEPSRALSPVATNHSNHSQSSHHSQQSGNSSSTYIHQTSDTPPQNCDQFNPSPVHSSLIFNNSNGFSGGGGGVGIGGSSGIGSYKNTNKCRKGSASNTSAGITISNSSSNNHYNNISHTYQNNYLPSSNTNYTGEPNDTNWDGFAGRSRTSSPTHTNIGGGSSSSYYKYERSKNRTSYDIDNIVIPYSVAAATRVEILPYKEIPTPKWRVIDEDRGGVFQMSLDPTMDMDKSLEKITTPDNDKSKFDANQIFLNKTSPLSNNSQVKGTKSINDEVSEVKIMVKKVAINTSIEESNKSIAIDEIKYKDVLMKKNPLPVNSSKIAEQRNNILKNNSCGVIKNESRNVETDHLISKFDVELEEPAEKKGKMENFIESKDFQTGISMITEIYELKKPEVNCVTDVATKHFTPKPVVNYKRGIRLKRIYANKGESMEVDYAAEEAELEHITDDAIMLRHERKLAEERRKFKTYLKFPWSTRSRANRRIDSRAESSGTNTPDPTSPAPQTPSIGGGDQESIPSPLAPSIPLNPLDAVSETGDNGTGNPPPPLNTSGSTNSNGLCKNLERRRTTSTKKEREMERRSSTPDLKEVVPPYEPLKFPLSDEAFEGLLKAMPAEFHYLNFDSKYLEDCNTTDNVTSGTKIVRQRSNCRSDAPVAISRRGKIASTMQNCDVIYNRKQRINNSSRRGGNTVGRGRRRGYSSRSRAKTNNDLSNGVYDTDGINSRAGVVGIDIDDDDEDVDDDEVDLLTILAQEDDDCDYPKHHLAPGDGFFDGGTVNDNTRKSLMEIEDEYDAYLGRQHRDSDANSTDSEPFADDDPNDPEWCGDNEDRGGGGASGVFGTEKYRRSIR